MHAPRDQFSPFSSILSTQSGFVDTGLVINILCHKKMNKLLCVWQSCTVVGWL